MAIASLSALENLGVRQLEEPNKYRRFDRRVMAKKEEENNTYPTQNFAVVVLVAQLEN